MTGDRRPVPTQLLTAIDPVGPVCGSPGCSAPPVFGWVFADENDETWVAEMCETCSETFAAAVLRDLGMLS